MSNGGFCFVRSPNFSNSGQPLDFSWRQFRIAEARIFPKECFSEIPQGFRHISVIDLGYWFVKVNFPFLRCVSAFEDDAMLQYLHSCANSQSVMQANSLYPTILELKEDAVSCSKQLVWARSGFEQIFCSRTSTEIITVGYW